MSNAAPTAPTLSEKVVETIKTAGDLVTALETELKAANTKLAAATGDTKEANERLADVIEKMASVRVNGELLIQPDQKDLHLEAVRDSKYACADLIGNLFDILQSSVGSSKNANDTSLGEPSDDVSPYAETDRPTSGFGSLRSKNIRM